MWVEVEGLSLVFLMGKSVMHVSPDSICFCFFEFISSGYYAIRVGALRPNPMRGLSCVGYGGSAGKLGSVFVWVCGLVRDVGGCICVIVCGVVCYVVCVLGGLFASKMDSKLVHLLLILTRKSSPSILCLMFL